MATYYVVADDEVVDMEDSQKEAVASAVDAARDVGKSAWVVGPKMDRGWRVIPSGQSLPEEKVPTKVRSAARRSGK